MSYTKFNFFFLSLSSLFFLFLQTSVWPLSFSPPQFIVPFLVFVFAYRRPMEAMFLIYIFVSFSSLFTASSFGVLLCVYFVLFILNVIVNDRFFKRDINYFTISCFVNTFAMGLIFSLLSSTPFYVLNWFLSSFFTSLMSVLFYMYFIWLDKKTQKEELSLEGAFF